MGGAGFEGGIGIGPEPGGGAGLKWAPGIGGKGIIGIPKGHVLKSSVGRQDT